MAFDEIGQNYVYFEAKIFIYLSIKYIQKSTILYGVLLFCLDFFICC